MDGYFVHPLQFLGRSRSVKEKVSEEGSVGS
jgi:hypothetical protein